MKAILHKISAVVLTLLVVFSTVSLTVGKHFCGSTLIDVSLFSTTTKCGDDAMTKSSQPTLKKMSCCKDVVEVISGQDELDSKSLEDLTSVQKNLLSAFVFSYERLFKPRSTKTLAYKDYQVPILVYDIALLDQVFLI